MTYRRGTRASQIGRYWRNIAIASRRARCLAACCDAGLIGRMSDKDCSEASFSAIIRRNRSPSFRRLTAMKHSIATRHNTSSALGGGNESSGGVLVRLLTSTMTRASGCEVKRQMNARGYRCGILAHQARRYTHFMRPDVQTHQRPLRDLEPDPFNCPGCNRHSGRGSFFQAVGLSQVPKPGALQRVTGQVVAHSLSFQQAAARTFKSRFIPDRTPQRLHYSPRPSVSSSQRPDAAGARH